MKYNIVLSIILLGILLTEAEPRRNRPQHTNSNPIEVCHPIPSETSTKNAQYLIGYGSLMQTESKTRTAPDTGNSIPVQVKGYRREWNAQAVGIGASTTYLGVVKDNKSSFNGVVFELPLRCQNLTGTCANILLNTLRSYDAREEWYCREKVPSKDIVPFLPEQHKELLKNGDFWIYLNKPEFTIHPTERYPIVQSYVDIFISGCLEIEQKFNVTNFTDNCIQTTHEWSTNWINDRIYPRRPFIFEPKAEKIDKALYKNLPKYFNPFVFEKSHKY